MNLETLSIEDLAALRDRVITALSYKVARARKSLGEAKGRYAGELPESLSVTLGTEPSDLAVSIHPLIEFGFAFEARNLSGFCAFIIRDNFPIIIGDSNGPEGHLCFCHNPM